MLENKEEKLCGTSSSSNNTDDFWRHAETGEWQLDAAQFAVAALPAMSEKKLPLVGIVSILHRRMCLSRLVSDV